MASNKQHPYGLRAAPFRSRLTRRHFLAFAGGVGATSVLAACGLAGSLAAGRGGMYAASWNAGAAASLSR
jgi:hypothetical protein